LIVMMPDFAKVEREQGGKVEREKGGKGDVRRER
jgi:hypothetical protein